MEQRMLSSECDIDDVLGGVVSAVTAEGER